MKYAIVLTTINVPHVVGDYMDNIEKFGHAQDVEIIVVGDRKTPIEAEQYVTSLGRNNVHYMSVQTQNDWLAQFDRLPGMIPWNSDNRRNVGYLKAAEDGADVIISIDDDNWPLLDEDFIEGHSIVGKALMTEDCPEVRSPGNNWVNICTLIQQPWADDYYFRIYPRGFPYRERYMDTFQPQPAEQEDGRVVLNEGLWNGNPDVDASTRLSWPGRVEVNTRTRYTLGRNQWSPFNSQNTAFHRDILPVMYFVPMNFLYNGLVVDRFGDIWMGYLALKVIHAIGERATFGPPIVVHNRNVHSLLNDLKAELGGMLLNEVFTVALDRIHLVHRSYSNAYVELGDKVADWMVHCPIPGSCKDYFARLASNMEVWVEACEKVTT